MAKAGFWLKGAKGKLGSMSLANTMDGTVVRTIKEEIKNPKTEKQLYQRAVMATVMQAYAAGKNIFNHSFEGKSRGAECQRQFLALNARLLRARLSADLAEGNTNGDCTALFVAPKAYCPVPNEYIISRGSYHAR